MARPDAPIRGADFAEGLFMSEGARFSDDRRACQERDGAGVPLC